MFWIHLHAAGAKMKIQIFRWTGSYFAFLHHFTLTSAHQPTLHIVICNCESLTYSNLRMKLKNL